MIEAKLPSFLKPQNCTDLIRVGRRYDGGYVISKSDINSTDILVGLGINNDWSFEAQFVKLKDIPVFAYDASISKKIFLSLVLNALPKLHRPKLIASRVWTYFSYGRFFRRGRTHIEKFVGPDEGDQFVPLKYVFESVCSKKMFLKIDIEGGEYGLLDDIIENQNSVCGLVIEFHDCELHLSEIKKFIEQFQLILVHIHANNFAPVNKHMLPSVIELTFSSTANFIDRPLELPIEIDMPNNRFEEDIKITF